MSAMHQSSDNSDDLREEERLEESLEYLKELDLKVRYYDALLSCCQAHIASSTY